SSGSYAEPRMTKLEMLSSNAAATRLKAAVPTLIRAKPFGRGRSARCRGRLSPDAGRIDDMCSPFLRCPMGEGDWSGVDEGSAHHERDRYEQRDVRLGVAVPFARISARPGSPPA